MWAQLGMAALKSLQDEQNKKQEIASNVITQKYAPYTGQRADFSAIGRNNTLSNFASGAMAGYMQDKMQAREAESDLDNAFTKQAASEAPTPKAPMAPGVVRTPAGANTSSFSAPKQMSTFESLISPQQAPQVPYAPQENPFLSMAREYQPEVSRAPAVQAPAGVPFQDPTQASRSALWKMLPDSMPIKRGY